jgi:hypothetical protein
MQPDQQNKRGMDVLYLVARSMATTLTPFLRKGFGAEGIGWYGLGAFLILLLAIGDTRDPAITAYFWLWIGALLLQRFRLSRPVAGHEQHSNYGGYPVVAAKLFRCGKENRAKLLEIPVVMSVGVLVGLTVSDVLGGFLVLACVGLAVTRMLEYQHNWMRARRMKDAQLEMEALVRFQRGDTDY